MEKTPGISLRVIGERRMRELAACLAELLRPGDVVLLVGELGTGKTCFVRGMAEGLGVQEKVLSPTFTLLREYRGHIPLCHLDAYRLEGAWDLYDLGLEEFLEAEWIIAVEWGDRVRDFFREDHLEVRIYFGDGEDERLIQFIPRGASWVGRLRMLAEDQR